MNFSITMSMTFAYEMLSSLIPFLIMLVLFRQVREKFLTPVSKWDYILPAIFAVYVTAVFHITGAGTLYDGLTTDPEEMKERINLMPFSNKIDIIGYLLNVVMFIPLGFFIPLIWKQLYKLSNSLFAGAAFSILIELSQLLSYRGTDIDDIIMNTLGAAIGCLLFKMWDRISRSKYQFAGIDSWELPAYILVLFLGRFLLFNYVGLIDFIYGF